MSNDTPDNTSWMRRPTAWKRAKEAFGPCRLQRIMLEIEAVAGLDVRDALGGAIVAYLEADPEERKRLRVAFEDEEWGRGGDDEDEELSRIVGETEDMPWTG